MKQISIRSFCLACLLFVLTAAPAWSASYNLGSKSALQSYINSMMNNTPGNYSDTINGQSINWYIIGFGQGDVTINGVLSTFGTVAEAFDAVYNVIASSMAVGSISSPNSPSQVTSRLVYDNLVLPVVKTATELRLESEKKAKGEVRTFGAMLRGEFVKANDSNGVIYGFNLGVAYDKDKYTFGVMVPYDRIDIGSLEGNRAGLIAYGQYHLTPLKDWELSLTGNMNYLLTQLHLNSSDDNLHTYGAGLSTALRYIQDKYELGSGFSYQYNRSENVSTDNDQHLLKLGLNGGYRITPDNVISAHSSWTCDVTSYRYKPDKDNYFEVGTEYRTNLSDTWSFSLGYKKVLGLTNFRSDLVYIGTLTQF